MSQSLLPLSLVSDPNGYVDFLANKTKRNYLNLKGINDNETIECVKSFMVRYLVWSQTDLIVAVKRPVKYVPEQFHNISFVLTFYDMARQTYEKRPVHQVIENVSEEKIKDKDIVPEESESFQLVDDETESDTESEEEPIRKNKTRSSRRRKRYTYDDEDEIELVKSKN